MTEFYRDNGHIGYSIVPDKRRQGYETEMLKSKRTCTYIIVKKINVLLDEIKRLKESK